MSGGSYDYLFVKDTDQLFSMTTQLRDMADRLAALGWAADAAAETEAVLAMIRQFDIRLSTRKDRLSGIWRATEWWDSGDSGPDYLTHELAKYRDDETVLAKYPEKGQESCRATGKSRDSGYDWCGYRAGHEGGHTWEDRYAG